MSAFGPYVVAIGIAGGLVGASFEVAQASADFCPPNCASGKVRLGISAPTSGLPAAFGQQAVKPTEVAVHELNTTGGLMGRPAELVVGDDRCGPSDAVEVAKRLIEKDKINVVIGPICPPAATAAAPIYAKAAGLIQFLPTVPMMEFMRQSSDKIFRMVVTDEQEAKALGDYLAREQKGKKLTVVYTDAFYRRAMVEMIKAALAADMKMSTQFKPLLDSSGAYDRLAEQLQRDQPDVVYLALDNPMVVELVGRLRKGSVKYLLVGGQRLLSQNFWSTAREAAEGIHVIAPIGSTTNIDFRKTIDLIKQADVVPDLVALNSYAAVQTWSEAVRRAGGGDPAKVVEALRTGEFPTAVGLVAFDQQGNRRNVHYSVLSWEGGAPETAS